MCKIAHVICDDVPHLSGKIIRWFDDGSGDFYYYLRDVGRYADEKMSYAANKPFFDAISSNKFAGYLKTSWWGRRPWISGYLRYLFQITVPEFDVFSLIRLVFGPRRIVIHGRSLQLPVMLLLRLCRKKIVYVNWGCPPHVGRFKGFLDKLALKLNSWIFVLMTPEIRYFKDFVQDRVSVLPYGVGLHSIDSVDIIKNRGRQSNRKIIIGNSTILRDTYSEILDRLRPEDWDLITCMLNYGREDEMIETDRFVAKYEAKFGEKFFAWRTTLPYDEYMKIIGQSAFYICPTRTQMGLGAISNGILQGKTIFLRGDNLNWLRELGVEVIDIDSVDDFTFDGLNKYIIDDVKALRNLVAFRENFALKYSDAYWREQVYKVLK